MKVSQLVTRFQYFLDDPQGSRWKRESALLFLNDAQQDLAQICNDADEGFFREAVEFSVVASPGDSYEFDLPADFDQMKTVERVSGTEAPVPGMRTTFRDRHSMYGYAWEPVYYIEGMKFGIVDPQDSYTVRVYYLKVLPTLEEDQDESLIPAGHHSLLALHAARMALGSHGYNIAPALEEEYQRRMAKLVTYLDGRRKSEPRYVRTTAS